MSPQPCVSGCEQDYERRKGSHVHNHTPADRHAAMTVCKASSCGVPMRQDQVFNRAGRFMGVGWSVPEIDLNCQPVVPPVA